MPRQQGFHRCTHTRTSAPKHAQAAQFALHNSPLCAATGVNGSRGVLLSPAGRAARLDTWLAQGDESANYSARAAVQVTDALGAAASISSAVRVAPYVLPAGEQMAGAASSVLSQAGYDPYAIQIAVQARPALLGSWDTFQVPSRLE